MSIQFTVPGFEPMTLVSSHNHQTRPPAQYIQLFAPYNSSMHNFRCVKEMPKINFHSIPAIQLSQKSILNPIKHPVNNCIFMRSRKNTSSTSHLLLLLSKRFSTRKSFERSYEISQYSTKELQNILPNLQKGASQFYR